MCGKCNKNANPQLYSGKFGIIVLQWDSRISPNTMEKTTNGYLSIWQLKIVLLQHSQGSNPINIILLLKNEQQNTDMQGSFRVLQWTTDNKQTNKYRKKL